MKAELLYAEDHGKELVNFLDIFDYVLMNLEARSNNKSELTCYRKFAYILDVLLRGTPFKLVDGKHTSEATKEARNINMMAANDDDDKKKLIGRKIDLIIKGSDIELNSSEWKKSPATTRAINDQRVKNICTNSAMLHKLRELVNRDDLFLLGMDWVGFVGVTFSITTVSNVQVVHPVKELVFPLSMNTIDMFKETLELLFVMKQHNLDILKLAISAIERRNIKQQFKRMTRFYKKLSPTLHSWCSSLSNRKSNKDA